MEQAQTDKMISLAEGVRAQVRSDETVSVIKVNDYDPTTSSGIGGFCTTSKSIPNAPNMTTVEILELLRLDYKNASGEYPISPSSQLYMRMASRNGNPLPLQTQDIAYPNGGGKGWTANRTLDLTAEYDLGSAVISPTSGDLCLRYINDIDRFRLFKTYDGVSWE